MNLGAYIVDRRPLKITAFRRLWTASVVSAVGGSFSVVAVPTQLFTLTGSSATVGAAAFVSMCTLSVSAMWSGAVAMSQTAARYYWLNTALGVTYVGLWLHTALELGSLYYMVLVALQGASLGATLPTMGAVVPRLVPADQLVAANSLSSLTRYTGAVLGPLLATVLIPLVGLGMLCLLDALALTAALWAVSRLPPMRPTGARATPVPGWGAVRQLGDGFRYLASKEVLVAILAVGLAAMVFGMPVALFPELAERVYGGASGGGYQLGLLFAAYPAGVFLLGLFSGTFSRAKRHGVLMASSAVAWGGCVVLLGLLTELWSALLLLVGGGAVNFALSTFRNAISQEHADDALRGRIQGALIVVLLGGPQLANVLHGLGGAVLGARWTVSIGGALTMLTVAMVVRVAPKLWRYQCEQSR